MTINNYFSKKLFLLILTFLIGVLLFVLIIFYFFYPSFQKLSEKIILSKYRNILVDEHNSLQNFIQANEIVLLNREKNKLKERIRWAYEISYQIFKENLNRENGKELSVKSIKEILNRPGDKFLIIDTNGFCILNSLNHRLEGKNIIYLKDYTGEKFIKRIIDTILIKREGYFEYYDNSTKYLIYATLFEPFSWIICVVKDYNKILNKVEKDILKILELNVEAKGFYFVILKNKKLLFQDNPITIKNVKLGLSEDKSFIYEKSYLPELKWEIISVFDKSVAKKEILEIDKRVFYIIKIFTLIFGIATIIVFLIIFFTTKNFKEKIESEISKFQRFIKKIPRSFEKIEKENFKFSEFQFLIENVNKMSELLKELFSQIKKEKEYLEIITENSGVLIAIINKDKKIEYANSSFKNLVTYEGDKNFDKNFYNYIKLKKCIGKCSFGSENCVISKIFKDKKQYISYDETIVTLGEREVPVFFIATPIIENDVVQKIVLILKDATEERRIKSQLMTLKRAIEQAPVSIVITDVKGNIEYVNPFFCKVTGYSYSEAIGKNPKILSTKYNKKFYKDLWEHILSGKVWEGEFLNRRKDGKTYWERAIIAPVFNEDGKITNFVAVKEDITELKKLQQELIKAKEKAEIASKVKSEFLASMSHEIRTPMNAILGFIDILLETDLDNTQREYLEIIKQSSENLLRILNDILDLSKLEAGKFEFEQRNFNLHELISNCINVFSKKAGEKGLSLRYEINENVPSYLKGDPTRISQVINNLLSNAIKFTERGEVGIKVELEKMEDNFVTLHFVVYDTGVGIPEDKVDKIFEEFSQVDSSVSRKYGGTGLGLAIVKKIVEVYNGKIWVKSKVGEGSEFHFTLNLYVGEQKKEKVDKKETYSSVKFEKVKILVAEDNLTNQILIREIFKKLGINIDLAENGIKAIEKIARKDYDLIFLDWHMPKMDGLEVIKILRDLENGKEISDDRINQEVIEKLKNRKFTIIALTAAVMDNEREILKNAGFDDFLSKPIQKEELLRVLKKYLNKAIVSDTQEEDLDELKEFLGDDKELINELISTFKESLNENIEKIENAIIKKDFNEIYFSAHAIKGAAFNIKLNRIGEIAMKLENFAKNKDLENIRLYFSKLKKVKLGNLNEK